MNGVITANDNSLQNILERVAPHLKRKKIGNTRATAKVKKSVKGKTTGITSEQGFRNYLKYTDPMLQYSDETTDASKIANDLSQILSTFKPNTAPHVLEPEKKVVEKAKKYLKKEPVSDKDIASEIATLPISRQLLADKGKATSILQGFARAKIDANDLQPVLAEEIKKKNASKTVASIFRAKLANKSYNELNEVIRETPEEFRRNIFLKPSKTPRNPISAIDKNILLQTPPQRTGAGRPSISRAEKFGNEVMRNIMSSSVVSPNIKDRLRNATTTNSSLVGNIEIKALADNIAKLDISPAKTNSKKKNSRKKKK